MASLDLEQKATVISKTRNTRHYTDGEMIIMLVCHGQPWLTLVVM